MLDEYSRYLLEVTGVLSGPSSEGSMEYSSQAGLMAGTFVPQKRSRTLFPRFNKSRYNSGVAYSEASKAKIPTVSKQFSSSISVSENAFNSIKVPQSAHDPLLSHWKPLLDPFTRANLEPELIIQLQLIDSLHNYFNEALRLVLLYEQERDEYESVQEEILEQQKQQILALPPRKSCKRKSEPRQESELDKEGTSKCMKMKMNGAAHYGAEFLLRLLGKVCKLLIA